VRNTYAICLELEHSSPKGGLTLHKMLEWHHLDIKSMRFQMSMRMIS
jgi:hypothetical protein